MTVAAPAWSEMDVRILRAGWASGKTATTIGKELDRTRNAVCGKVHRLNLVISNQRDPKRHQTVATQYRKPIKPKNHGKKKAKPAAPVVVKPVVVPELIGPVRAVTLIDLQWWHCRAPIGDALYCGRVIKTGSPYCIEHHDKFHQARR